MPRLSIVIPGMASVDALEETLLSVLENRPADTEIIAVLNGEYADPYQLQGEVRFAKVATGEDFVRCATIGIDQARSDVVHLLKAGCTVREGWTDAAVRHFADRSVAAVAPAIYRFQRPEQLLAQGIGYRAGGGRYYLLDADEAEPGHGSAKPVFGASGLAAFFRASLVKSVGGFDAQVGSDLADVDLAWRLCIAGFRAMHEPQSVIFTQPASLRTSESAWQRGLHAERLFWRSAGEVGWSRALASHAGELAASVLKQPWNPAWMIELAARAKAACQFSVHLEHRHRLAKLRAANPRTVLLQGPHFRSRSESTKTATRKVG